MLWSYRIIFLSYEVFTEWPGRERKVTSRALSELGHSDSKPPGMSVDGVDEILLAVQTAAEYRVDQHWHPLHPPDPCHSLAVGCLAVSPAGETVALRTNPARVLG